jgi:chaperonin GroEL (HSP60 family)
MESDNWYETLGALPELCDVVGTALGPFGASKLVLTEHGEVSTVASAATVLDRLSVEDPAVTLLDAATTGFADRHGDGTTTVVALVGALLEEADSLLEMGVHSAVVERGYRTAADVAIEAIGERTRPVSTVGLSAVAQTSLGGVRNPLTRETVGENIVRGVETIDAEGPGPIVRDRITVTARIGPPSETELVRGLVLEYDPVINSMPESVADAGVAVLSSTVDTPTLAGETARSDRSVSLAVDSFDGRRSVREHEREAFREQLSAAVDAGCRVVATGTAVNDRVKRALANSGVIAVQRVDEADLQRLALATGASVCPSLDHVTAETLGRADVTGRRLAGRHVYVVESGAGDPAYTLLCRAPDPRSVDSFRRSVESAVASTVRASREGTVVPGGGAAELAASRAVRDHARSVTGREQLAVEAFAGALRVVPRRLASSAGLSEWTTLTGLVAAHANGRDTRAVDVLAGEPADVLDGESPVADPTGLKRDIVSVATDLTVRLIRIDGRLPATELDPEDEPDEDAPEAAGGPA